MAKKSGGREAVKMVSSVGTGYFYTTERNKKNMGKKLEIKKYDPVIKKHVLFKESKI